MRLPVNHIEELGLWTAEIGKGEMIQESVTGSDFLVPILHVSGVLEVPELQRYMRRYRSMI